MCAVYDTVCNKQKIFEISENTSNTEEYIIKTLKDIVKVFKTSDYMFCGYNNNHYDNAFINFIFQNIKFFDYSGINNDIFLENVNTLHNNILHEDIETWKEYKYVKEYSAFDLMTMNFSKSERISLAELKFSFNINSIVSAKNMLTSEGMKISLSDDLEAIHTLLDKSKEKINLRMLIHQEYNIGTLSLDDVSLGMKIFSSIFLQRTGIPLKEYKRPQVPKEIKLSDIILPEIKFTTAYLQNILEQIKTKVISLEKPEFEEKISVFGSSVSLGLGGLHSSENPKINKVDPWNVIIHIDAESMYPNFVSNYKSYPEFLGNDFFVTYMNMIALRIKAKNESNEAMNSMLKKILVSMVGMFNNPNSPIYDPLSFYTITINTQLLLLRFAEKMHLRFALKFLQWNTDGIFVEMNKYQAGSTLEEVINQFKDEYKIKFVTTQYEALYQYDINNYFAIKYGFEAQRKTNRENLFDMITCKGMFKAPTKSFRASNASVIAKAVIMHFLFKADVSKIIAESAKTRQEQFLFFSKIPESTCVYYGDTKVNNENRYYYSKSGFSLTSRNHDSGSFNFISDKGHPVKILNVLRKVDDIDTNYYSIKANTIIAKLQFTQLKMF